MGPFTVLAGEGVVTGSIKNRHGILVMGGVGDAVGILTADFLEVVNSRRHVDPIFVNNFLATDDINGALNTL